MQRRIGIAGRAYGQMDASESESESASESGSGSEGAMRCVSCQEEYGASHAGTCRECYKEAKETEDELKRQIDDLSSSLAFLRSAPSFSDVVLLAHHDAAFSLVPIPAHKAVLASRSEVFRAMLDTEMKESQSGTIKIGEVSYDALRAFVNYLYRAEASLDEHMACDLLVLAERYQVSHLKAFCERYLATHLTWDSSVATYAFAQQHNAQLLRDTALSLITDNIERLTIREEYLDLRARDPRLIVDIYEAYLAKQVNTAAPRDGSSRE